MENGLVTRSPTSGRPQEGTAWRVLGTGTIGIVVLRCLANGASVALLEDLNAQQWLEPTDRFLEGGGLTPILDSRISQTLRDAVFARRIVRQLDWKINELERQLQGVRDQRKLELQVLERHLRTHAEALRHD